MFTAMDGVLFKLLLKVVIPRSLILSDSTMIETNLFSYLDNRCRDILGEGEYGLSLWSNTQPSQATDKEQAYYLFLIFRIARYLKVYSDMLYFVSSFIRHSNDVTAVRFFFVPTSLLTGNTPFGTREETLYQLNSTDWKSDYRNVQMTIEITRLMFCYQVGVDVSEIEVLARNIIRILETNLIIRRPHFDRYRLNGQYAGVSVCLSDAFNAIPESMNYLLLGHTVTGHTTELTTPVGVQVQSVNTQIETISKSVAATACTAVVVIFIVGIRRAIRKMMNVRHQNSSRNDSAINVTDMRSTFVSSGFVRKPHNGTTDIEMHNLEKKDVPAMSSTLSHCLVTNGNEVICNISRLDSTISTEGNSFDLVSGELLRADKRETDELTCHHGELFADETTLEANTREWHGPCNVEASFEGVTYKRQEMRVEEAISECDAGYLREICAEETTVTGVTGNMEDMIAGEATVECVTVNSDLR